MRTPQPVRGPMKKLIILALSLLTIGVIAQAPLPQGAPGPNIPKGKAPEQGYVPDGWPAHPGSLMKYSVEIRFGEEPETHARGDEIRAGLSGDDRQRRQRVCLQTRSEDGSTRRLQPAGKISALVGQGHVHSPARPPHRSRSERVGARRRGTPDFQVHAGWKAAADMGRQRQAG